MRSFLRDHWKAIVVILLLVVLATFTVTPGAAPVTPSLAERLRAHVAAIASERHDSAYPDQLERAARYIETALRSEGYAVRRQADGAGGQALRNLEASVANLAPHARPERIFIVGTHYGESPDGTGSGPAAVLELARLLKNLRPSQGTEVKFVFFGDDAPPWFPGRAPDAGNFIAFVGTLASARPVQQALSAFQRVSGFPAHGLAAPAYAQGVTLSGHAATQRAGDPAILITDTAFGRYPYFETGQDGADDPADGVDYAGVARVVGGLAHTIEALAAGRQS